MKKLIVFSAILLTAASAAFAQSDTTAKKDRLAEIEALVVKEKKHRSSKEIKTTDFKVLPYLGIGTHLISSDEFESTNMDSYEVNLGLCEFQFNPAKWVGFSLGVDYAWDRYRSRESAFVPDGRKKINVSGGTLDKGEYWRSSMYTQSIAFPVSVSFRVDKLTLRASAEYVRGFDSSVTHIYRKDNLSETIEWEDLKIYRSFWDFCASVSYDGFGLYYKYYPTTVLYYQGAPRFDIQTIGVVLGF